MKKIVIILLLFTALMPAYSQNPEWVNIVSKYVEGMTDDGENIWIAGAGLVKINKQTNEIVTYNHANSGLPNNYTTCITSSKTLPGTLWIGTRTKGLIKYDGSNWEIINLQNENIDEDYVLCVETDTNGQVYIGTVFEGIGIYNGIYWRYYNEDNLPFQIGSIQKIKFKDGTLWANDLSSFIKYDGKTWTNYDLEDYGETGFITTFDIDNNNDIWFGDDCGNLYYFDRISITKLSAFEECVPTSRVIYIDCHEDTVYIATGDGLVIYDRKKFTKYNTQNSIMKEDRLNAVIVDEDNVKWIASANSGLYRYDNQDWKEISNYNSGLWYLGVGKIKIDNQGNKWMSTDAGIVKYDNENWDTYKFDEPGNYEIYGETYNFDIDKYNDIWAFAWSSIYKYKGDSWEKYDTEDYGLPELFSKYVTAIDTNNTIWIVSDIGLVKFDTTGFKIYDTTNSILPNNDIYSLSVDKKNNKWIFCVDNSIIKFDDENWTIYNKETTGQDIFNWPLGGQVEDKNGNLWFNSDSSLLIYDGNYWREDWGNTSDIPMYLLHPRAKDSTGNIWFSASDSGIVKFDGESWIKYNHNNSGMPDDWIESVAIDKYNNKWIGTYSSGLAVFREGGVILSTEDETKFTQMVCKINCFPNPASNNINIQINNIESGNITLKLFDIFGREICTIYDGFFDGNLNLVHRLGNISSGTYFIVLSTAVEKQAVRIVVSN